jgi:hypothetical protein
MCGRTGEFIVLRQSCGGTRAIPVDCGDALCIECEKARAAERAAKWEKVIRAMRRPVMLTLTIKDGDDLRERIQTLQASIRRLLDMRLGSRNRPIDLDLAQVFTVAHYYALVEKGDMTAGEAARRVNDWQKSFILFDKRIARYSSPPRFRDICGKGLAVFECTWCGDWHPHRHLILDMGFIPWPYLVILWRRATRGDGEIVDVRSLFKTDRDLREVMKYVTKPWLIPEHLKDEFRDAVRGLKRVWPIGGAKPVKVDKVCPVCKSPACTAQIMGMGEHATITRTQGMEVMEVKLGDNHDARTLTFVKDGGNWLEAKPEALYLILREVACHSTPSPPPGALA